MWIHSGKMAIYETEILPELDYAGTLILDFQTPELGENKYLLFKSPSLWYFVLATWED